MTNYRFLVWLTVMAWMMAVPHTASAKTRPPEYIQEMQHIVAQTDLSNAEKIARLQPYLKREESRMSALHFMRQVDTGVARDAAIALFRKSVATENEKLMLGRFLLTAVDPGAFRDEYAKYLVQAVLDGEKEFLRVLEAGAYTAVGEYAYLAAGANSYHSVDFEKMKDARVIPILIRCLRAPDDVWPTEQGDKISGKPGKATGRNIARQNIPFALARLGATDAIPALQEIVRTHKDSYLQKNAAEALKLLTKRE